MYAETVATIGKLILNNLVEFICKPYGVSGYLKGQYSRNSSVIFHGIKLVYYFSTFCDFISFFFLDFYFIYERQTEMVRQNKSGEEREK